MCRLSVWGCQFVGYVGGFASPDDLRGPSCSCVFLPMASLHECVRGFRRPFSRLLAEGSVSVLGDESFVRKHDRRICRVDANFVDDIIEGARLPKLEWHTNDALHV
mmetsp:Transcript_131136/g.407877  ORF Transcript_131136/g.407877 Transcript_131136/m.407877 type:complete len:106 (-) Transcript_131136:246-563(-)